MARASRWVVEFLAASTRLVLRVLGIKDAGPRTFVSEEEIKHLVREGRQQGVLDQTEMEIIHSVFEFTDMPVRKVMVPRPKIFALDADTPPGEVGSLIVESGFSRIPAYEGSVDNVVGVVYVKDALRLLEKRQPVVIRKILHPVHLVPETKKVGELLKELQKRRSHMAVVVDEHGSVSGLVTLEDLIEQIVGEIQDEYDWEERPVERMRDGSMVVEGTVSATELRENYEIPLPESGEFETVAGFMLEQLGSVPKGGEVVTTSRTGASRSWTSSATASARSRSRSCRRPRQGLTACATATGRRVWASRVVSSLAYRRGSDALVRSARDAFSSGRTARCRSGVRSGDWGSASPRAGGSARSGARSAGPAARAAAPAGGVSNWNGETSPPTRNERRSASVISVRRMTCGVRVITMSVCWCSRPCSSRTAARGTGCSRGRAGR